MATLLAFSLSQDQLSGWGWRIGFFIGPVLGLIIIYLRRHIPESPRWQLTHGHAEEAESNVEQIEREVEEQSGRELEPVPDSKAIEVRATARRIDRLVDGERAGTLHQKSDGCRGLRPGRTLLVDGGEQAH